MDETVKFVVIVPAAGVGKRMGADCPKQYLTINGVSVLEHTVLGLLSHPQINHVILSISNTDQYFRESHLYEHPDVTCVSGGKERVDSVLNGLYAVNQDEYPWVLVHDAARPCITHQDISGLIKQCLAQHTGGILAMPVRDTMKRGAITSTKQNLIVETVEREQLWHALTPQLYKTSLLISAIESGLRQELNITDESSAIELANMASLIIPGSAENIKITHPDDLLLAEFYLMKQNAQMKKEQQCE